MTSKIQLTLRIWIKTSFQIMPWVTTTGRATIRYQEIQPSKVSAEKPPQIRLK